MRYADYALDTHLRGRSLKFERWDSWLASLPTAPETVPAARTRFNYADVCRHGQWGEAEQRKLRPRVPAGTTLFP